MFALWCLMDFYGSLIVVIGCTLHFFDNHFDLTINEAIVQELIIFTFLCNCKLFFKLFEFKCLIIKILQGLSSPRHSLKLVSSILKVGKFRHREHVFIFVSVEV